MTIETLRMIYYAYFHSIINYGIIAWGRVYNNNLDLLRNLQKKKILRIVHKNKFICQYYPMNLEQSFTYDCSRFGYSTHRHSAQERASGAARARARTL